MYCSRFEGCQIVSFLEQLVKKNAYSLSQKYLTHLKNSSKKWDVIWAKLFLAKCYKKMSFFILQ